MNTQYDLVGIGFGPANIAVAIAMEEMYPEKSYLFVDTQEEIVWQKEMLFENALDVYSNIQNSPYRDLVTPRNPRSRYTFLNYLHENDRFWEQLNLNMSMPLRPDFAEYIAWVAKQFKHSFVGKTRIENISAQNDHYLLTTDDGREILAKNICMGTGRPANIPEEFRSVKSKNMIHFTRYQSSIHKMIAGGAKSIAIIGSSQTAAEIVLQVTKMYPEVAVDVIMRRFGFPLKDTTPFVSEIYFPEFTDLYYKADSELKKRIDRDVYGTNYGTADEDVIQEIYQQIYYDKMAGKNKLSLHRLTDICSVSEDKDKIIIEMENQMLGETTSIAYDAVILSTGFLNYGPHENNVKIPILLEPLRDHMALEQDAVSIGRRYDLHLKDSAPGKIMMNGLCEVTHGMGDAGSISLMSLRAKDIVDEIFRTSTKGLSDEDPMMKLVRA